MSSKRLVPVAVVLTLAGVAAAIAFWPTCSGQKITTMPGNPDQTSEDYVKATPARIAKLKQRIAEEKTAAEEAVNRYAPTSFARIDDLTAAVTDLLRNLPFVARVDVALRVRRPAGRIIHLRDYHFVQRDLFDQEMQSLMKRTLTVEETDQL
jgi:hypothetical protein